MNIFITLAIVLFFAKLGGYISKRLGQVTDVGEIIVGIILGPGLLAIFEPTEFFHHFADIGIILLMFLMGLEFDRKAFEKFLKGGILTAIFGAFVPFFGGIILGSAVFNWPPAVSFVFATILMATSISVVVTVLQDVKKTKTSIGYTLIDAAIVDNVLGVGMLALVLGVINKSTTSMFTFGKIGIEIIIFFAAVLLIGPKISKFFLKFGNMLDLRVKEGHLSIMLIVLFGLTFLAHAIGLSMLIGAFLAGVIFDKKHIKKIEHEVYSMTYGLFISVFFVFVGSFVDPFVLISNWHIVLLILFVALAGKFLGAFLGSSISGVSLRNSATIGIGMMGHCEVALAIAVTARSSNILPANIYTVIVSSLVLTVIITPVLLRYMLKKVAKT